MRQVRVHFPRQDSLVAPLGRPAFTDFSPESKGWFRHSRQDVFFEANESSAEDKENVPCVDGELVCSARGRRGGRGQARAARPIVARNRGGGPRGLVLLDVYCYFCSFHKLEKGLLDTLATDVPAVGCFSSRDLVELIQDHNSVLGRSRVVARFDQESLDTALDVLAYVTGLREGVAVAYCERDVELLAQGPAAPLSISGERLRRLSWQ